MSRLDKRTRIGDLKSHVEAEIGFKVICEQLNSKNGSFCLRAPVKWHKKLFLPCYMASRCTGQGIL